MMTFGKHAHKNISKIQAAILASAAVLGGCTQGGLSSATVNLTNQVGNVADYVPNNTNAAQDPKYDFAAQLLKHGINDSSNTVLSPASALAALSMLSNGAEGETLEEILTVLGEDSPDALNDLYAGTDFGPAVAQANSIWINDSSAFKANDEFLEKNISCYSASVFTAPFDDTTVTDMNKWVSDNTDGKIRDMFKELSSSNVMTLINVMTLEAKWSEPFDPSMNYEGTFKNSDGSTSSVEYMCSGGEDCVSLKYGADGGASALTAEGFTKSCTEGYKMLVLMPDEKSSLSELAGALDSDALEEIFSEDGELAEVIVPKFKLSESKNLNDVLQSMGINAAFDSAAADFSDLGTSENGNIYVGLVRQSCEIDINELGLSAAAATEVSLADAGALISETVTVDRPFIYMIVHSETGIPMFAGAVNKL